jgi:hypothetical protein
MKSRNRKTGFPHLSLPWDNMAPHASSSVKADDPDNSQSNSLEDYLDFLAGFKPTEEELRRTVVFKNRFTLPD